MKNKELIFPKLNLTRLIPQKEALALVPEDAARKYKILPVSVIGKILTIATSEPGNIFVFDDLNLITSYEIRICLAGINEISESIDRWYKKELLSDMLSEPEELPPVKAEVENNAIPDEVKNESDIGELIKKIEKEKFEVLTEEETAVKIEDRAIITARLEESPIVKLVERIILNAYRKRASDIHLEPYEKRFRIRYRIDGILYEEGNIPLDLMRAVIARIKIISNLNITEKRISQDGRFKMTLENKEIDYRVSILPISFGEKIVMRALDSSILSLKLSDLGFLSSEFKKIEEEVRKPYGMILVTGPTGSGKSTTLSAIISELNTPDRNIMTIEDPVEYQIPGVTQISTNPVIGFAFAEGLRSLLRQSPDIIMIGEIRDLETADIAVKASLTGQLVLSTLHTNDAASAINRLIDIGMEPFLLSSSIIMILAQRLMRKICRFCRQEVEIPETVLKNSGIEIPQKQIFYAGKRCEKCHNTGYYGRVAIGEVLLMDNEIKELAIRRASSDEIKEKAVSRGMVTLRDNAIINLKLGITTLEEVMRVTTEK
ncbi:MAG: ATPase, T2SS/T4P/T4SS family [Candidatus Ratteibacteria bacterium]|jgi:type IV pilus assembly protein PilB